ncbi:MAG: helix-turn-helix transcriptional regulator [Bacteroidota bacterium]
MAKKKLNRIGEILKEKGLTQAWLVAESEITQRSLSLYINGKREPTLDSLFRIAKALKVDPCELLNR